MALRLYETSQVLTWQLPAKAGALMPLRGEALPLYPLYHL